MRSFSKVVLTISLLILLMISTAELGLRIAREWAFPILPTVYDGQGVPHLAPNLDMRVKFGNREAIQYVTDAYGQRIRDRESAAADETGLRVLGDSQVLGYGLDFTQTFAHQLAAQLAQAGTVRILGSPGVDVETLAVGTCGEDDVAARPARFQVISLNLGNDLDEMYIAGQSRRPTQTSAFARWLIENSHLYASLEIWRSQQALARHPVPGVNPILFNLSSGERVRLASEAVNRIEEIARCNPAGQLVILILPSDFQVDPAELQKYAPFAADKKTFDLWYQKRTALARAMNSLEDYVIRKLQAGGYRVVSFRHGISTNKQPASKLFDRQSHHLTAAGHQAVAKLLMEAF